MCNQSIQSINQSIIHAKTAPNAATEEQAVNRVHRIGQTRTVVVKRFSTVDTIEHRMLLVRRARASGGGASFAVNENGLGAAAGGRISSSASSSSSSSASNRAVTSTALLDGSQTSVSALAPRELAFVLGAHEE